jgi:hypothetical protein
MSRALDAASDDIKIKVQICPWHEMQITQHFVELEYQPNHTRSLVGSGSDHQS